MLKKNKFKKIAVSLVLLLFLAFIGFSFVSAQLTPEVKYPKIGTKEITETTSLGDYISYIFSLGIIVGVLIAIGVLIYGGFLFLSSTGKPEQLKEAQDRIFAAFLGLIILLGSYLILATVNPQLTIIKTELVSLDRGVVLTDTIPPPDSSDNIKITEISVPDVQKIFGDKFEPQKIEIVGNSKGQLKVRAFRKLNYDETGDSTDWITDKLDDTGWVIKSLMVKGIGPGIYLHGDHNKELHLVGSHGDFRKVDDFNDKAKGIEIKNLIVGNEKKTDFAAILHTDTYFKGELRIFIEKRNEDRSGKVEGDIGNVPWDEIETSEQPKENQAIAPIVPPSYDGYGKVDGASSAHIFQIGSKENCKKVTLYTGPNFYSAAGASPCIIEDPIYKPMDISDVCGDKLGGGADPSNDKVMSIEIDGKCLVVLFQHDDATGKQSEVFITNDPDLTDNPIGQCKARGGWFWWITEPCTSAIAVYPLP